MVEETKNFTPVIKQKSNRVPILKKYSPSVCKPRIGGDGAGVEMGVRGQTTLGKCQETAWGPNPNQRDTHWITWETGDLEPPGIQTVHVRPTLELEDDGLKERPVRFKVPEPRSTSAVFSRSSSHQHRQSCLARAKTRDGYEDRIDAANFRSWHGKEPSEYEKEVTYNMMSHLNGSHAGKLEKMRRTRSGRYEHPVNFERRIVRDTFKSLNNPQEFYGTYGHFDRAMTAYMPSGKTGIDMSSAPMSGGRRAAIDYYPVSYHKPHQFESSDCTNASSFFQFTKPTIRGSFVIHPDFISERTEFSKNLKHSKSTKGKNGFRYGTSLPGV